MKLLSRFLYVTILAGALPTRGPSLEDMVKSTDDAYDAARLALFALRASVPDSQHVPHKFFLAPASTPLSEDQLIRRIIELPKPVRLRATIRSSGVEVTAITLVDSTEVAFQHLTGETDGRFVEDIKGKHNCASNASVLFRAGSRTLTGTLDVLKSMLVDFEVPSQIHSTAIDDQARATGACAIIVFSPVGDITVTTVPPPR